MELKEYLQIIKKDIKTFITLTVFAVVGTLAYFYFQPVNYVTSLTLNITRMGIEETGEYRYDGFYRLQADERFAETVVEWLGSPRIVADIYETAKINSQNLTLTNLSKSLKAEKRSSQIVAVNFSSATPEGAQKISTGIVKVISKNTEKLNESQKEKNWFQIMAENPVIARNVPNYKIIFLASFLVGIFAAFWVALVKDYLK